jgi:hypothetical protein
MLPRSELSKKNTYRPLSETQLHLAATLGSNSRLLLEAATDSAGRDGQVSVVAVEVLMLASSISGDTPSPRVVVQSQSARQWVHRRVNGSINIRQTSGFPRSSHFGGVEGVRLIRFGIGGE